MSSDCGSTATDRIAARAVGLCVDVLTYRAINRLLFSLGNKLVRALAATERDRPNADAAGNGLELLVLERARRTVARLFQSRHGRFLSPTGVTYEAVYDDEAPWVAFCWLWADVASANAASNVAPLA